MKKKSVIIGLFVMLLTFFVIKLFNFIIGQKILGEYTSLTNKSLKIKPIRRNVKYSNINPYLKSSLFEIKFDISKRDTFKTFKLREVYQSFYFRDSSSLKVFRDSANVDVLKILTSMTYSDNNPVENCIKENNIHSNFKLLLFAYNKTPKDISFFNLSRDNTIVQYTFLKLKDLCAISDEERGLYYYLLKNINAFQYGIPLSRELTTVQIFTPKGDEYLLQFKGFNQDQIDYVIASIDSSISQTAVNINRDRKHLPKLGKSDGKALA